ncbi:hypothetical protein JQ506_21985 [Shinella sp. PSBB067]|uniref:hypothetical protein n=1 Tax=Shinella sp. PSBB067 TaxID=2715959 RepID=UPI00193BE74E|nr:hypothetical protein [Shinella sp. PSBB067]QRI63446.1 hypothetical protein JQ506_21985 [Shinella sp. PSBB067]
MADQWRAEQDRQAKELGEILAREIEEFGQRLLSSGRQPILNAVASAIVAVTGSMLASVQDRKSRKALRRAIENGLPSAIADHEGKSGHAQIIVANRRADA